MSFMTRKIRVVKKAKRVAWQGKEGACVTRRIKRGGRVTSNDLVGLREDLSSFPY